jgi:exosortase family protein XrtF
VLFAIYSVYLQKSQENKDAFICASLTTKVAKQTTGLLRFFGYDAAYVQHDKEMSVKLLVNNTYVARVIEGCNSGSLIILFIAFIVAFSGSIKATFLYIVFGSLFIYFINIFRIAFLTLMLYRYPGQQTLLHNLVFPALIYGTIFLLWILWVKKFSYLKDG